jgi:hypothetical protein
MVLVSEPWTGTVLVLAVGGHSIDLEWATRSYSVRARTQAGRRHPPCECARTSPKHWPRCGHSSTNSAHSYPNDDPITSPRRVPGNYFCSRHKSTLPTMEVFQSRSYATNSLKISSSLTQRS